MPLAHNFGREGEPSARKARVPNGRAGIGYGEFVPAGRRMGGIICVRQPGGEYVEARTVVSDAERGYDNALRLLWDYNLPTHGQLLQMASL